MEEARAYTTHSLHALPILRSAHKYLPQPTPIVNWLFKH